MSRKLIKQRSDPNAHGLFQRFSLSGKTSLDPGYHIRAVGLLGLSLIHILMTALQASAMLSRK